MEAIIVDTGIIYAIIDKTDIWHKPAKDFISDFKGRLIVTSPVVIETCYLLNACLNQKVEAAFVNSLVSREFAIEHFNAGDLNRCLELLKKYDDINIGFVDASIVAIAERLKISKLLTTDRRHFSIVKPLHCQLFTLLP